MCARISVSAKGHDKDTKAEKRRVSESIKELLRTTHTYARTHTQVREFHKLQIEINKECRFEAPATLAGMAR